MFAVRLIEQDEQVAEELRFTYRHVLVDEYQDVAYAQHRLLRLLADEHRNLFAVGDPLQNLYSWRGSDIRHLLDFSAISEHGRSRWSRTTRQPVHPGLPMSQRRPALWPAQPLDNNPPGITSLSCG
jgi:hypothetical protein